MFRIEVFNLPIRDRGTKKWVSIMMPEQVRLSEDMYKDLESEA